MFTDIRIDRAAFESKIYEQVLKPWFPSGLEHQLIYVEDQPEQYTVDILDALDSVNSLGYSLVYFGAFNKPHFEDQNLGI